MPARVERLHKTFWDHGKVNIALLQKTKFKRCFARSCFSNPEGAGRSSRGRAFAHGAVGRRIDPSWCGPIELFLVPARASRLV